MSSCPSSDFFGPSASEVQTGQLLLSSSSTYFVTDFIGEGCFGKVARCHDMETNKTVAVKILKNTDFAQNTEKEVSMLKAISVLNPDLTNVVKFFERFEHIGQTCLAFEMLDRDLYDLIEERDFKPLSLQEIRPIAKQLMVALAALKGLGILHADIKPDNVMFVNVQDQPLRVKLIDFGQAMSASKVRAGLEIQPCGYRAPEVALGLPFTEAVDVWGVGCILAFLYLADNLFPVDCYYQMMKCIVDVLGQPEDHLLHTGLYTQFFFTEQEAADRPTWRLMTPEEYSDANGIEAKEWSGCVELPNSLEDLVYIYPMETAAEFEDRLAFVDYLKQLLHLDGESRISPHEALQHPFTTMSHLPKHPISTDYVSTSQAMMSICPVEDSAHKMNISAASKPGLSWSSDGAFDSYEEEPNPWSNDEESLLWSNDEESLLWSNDEEPLLWSNDEESLLWSNDEEPILWSSDGPFDSYDEEPHPWSYHKAVTARDLTASASSGSCKKMLTRIEKFFSRLGAALGSCWCSTVED